jgi:hypothetical protein
MQRYGVECLVVGGMAARLHESTMQTADVDTVARWTRSNLEALCRALDSVDAQLRIHADPDGDESADVYRRPPGGFDADVVRHTPSFRVRTAAGDQIDILQSIPLTPGPDGERAGFEQLLEHSQEFMIRDDVSILVAGLEDLLHSKAAVGRPHDIAVVRELQGKLPAPVIDPDPPDRLADRLPAPPGPVEPLAAGPPPPGPQLGM